MIKASIILHGSCIIEPENLQERAILIAHEGHQGLVKMKQLLREKVWFPKIDDRVKTRIEHGIACQANTLGSLPDPLQMSPLPPEPWHTVSVDHFPQMSICLWLLMCIQGSLRWRWYTPNRQAQLFQKYTEFFPLMDCHC